MEYLISTNVLKLTLASSFSAVIVAESTNHPGLVNSDNVSLTAGEGLIGIFEDFFPQIPTGRLKSILDIFHADGVNYIRIEIDGIQDRGQLLGKICAVTAPFVVQKCERTIVIDEERVAEESEQTLEEIEAIPGIAVRSGQTRRDRINTLILDEMASLFAHELCHAEVAQNPGGVFSDKDYWDLPINQCAREVYKTIYGGNDPLHYR